MPRARAVRMTRRAISPRLATSRVRIGITSSSQAEGREPGRAGHGRGMDCRQGETEHGPRVSRVDQAVVPQAGRGADRTRLPVHYAFDTLLASSGGALDFIPALPEGPAPPS